MRKLFTKLYSCGGRTAAYKKFGDYADFFYNEKDFPVVGWRFEIADEDGQKVYHSDIFETATEARKVLEIVLKNFEDEEQLKWKLNSDGSAYRGTVEGGIRKLLIKPAVVFRDEVSGVACESFFQVFNTEDEARQYIKEFVKARNKAK